MTKLVLHLPSEANQLIGETLSHYEMLSLLGKGGMGEVYLARDTRLGREVAVKVLPRECCGDPEALGRFRIEARAASALNHPGICTIHDVGEQDGQPFLVMECLQGQALNQRMTSGPMSDAEVRDIGSQIADALAAAHAANIFHRDIKPENIFLAGSGRAKVLDFGLAKFVPTAKGPDSDTTATQARATKAGAFIGTVSYVSPEQALSHALDARSDLFSLGVVLYEMVTGRLPFTGTSTVATLNEILNSVPQRPSDIVPGVSQELEATILRLLEKDPDDRVPSAAQLSEDLARAQTSIEGAGPDAERLDEARLAIDQQDWARARELYTALDTPGQLSGQDLRASAQAAFWLGHDDQVMRLHERAHARFLDEGDRISAGDRATAIAEFHYSRCATSVFNGWLRRAEALLADTPDTPASGRLFRLKTTVALNKFDLDQAEEFLERVKSIADQTGDPDLRVLAMVDEGQLLVRRGRVADGMAMLDEAMASSLGTEVDPQTLGRTYCNMISACGLIGDFRRAIEWNDETVKWCDPHQNSFYPGMCSVRRAEISRKRGELDTAEAQARQAAKQHEGAKAEIAREAWYELGEILLVRGELEEAAAAFDEAHQRGHHTMPGLALLRCAEGRSDLAVRALTRALEAAPHALNRLRLLPAAVTALLDTQDVDGAARLAQEIEDLTADYDAPIFVGEAHLARGCVELARGQHEAAVSNLQIAIKNWSDAEMPHRVAQTRVVLSRAYLAAGDADAAGMELRSARAVFENLGAKLDLRGL